MLELRYGGEEEGLDVRCGEDSRALEPVQRQPQRERQLRLVVEGDPRGDVVKQVPDGRREREDQPVLEPAAVGGGGGPLSHLQGLERVVRREYDRRRGERQRGGVEAQEHSVSPFC